VDKNNYCNRLSTSRTSKNDVSFLEKPAGHVFIAEMCKVRNPLIDTGTEQRGGHLEHWETYLFEPIPQCAHFNTEDGSGIL
jgi:hypothetical protein